MNTTVEVVDVFKKPYEVWTRRRTSPQEYSDLVLIHRIHPTMAGEVKDRLLEVVSTPRQAAECALKGIADNGLEYHIDSALDSSVEYATLCGMMPSAEPEELHSYKHSFTDSDWAPADAAIKRVGAVMAEGQFLFHGGLWPGSATQFVTTRPFSTSFCPQVALRNAEWSGKAYDSERVDLMVVRLSHAQTKAYAYSRDREKGYEKEVVFESGARLRKVSEAYIADKRVYKPKDYLQVSEKVVPTYLIEVEMC